jgi:hypothetical protein
VRIGPKHRLQGGAIPIIEQRCLEKGVRMAFASAETSRRRQSNRSIAIENVKRTMKANSANTEPMIKPSMSIRMCSSGGGGERRTRK